MTIRAAVEKLPKSVRHELNKRLIASAFSEFGSHTAWLKDQGYSISRSAVHRYGTRLKYESLSLGTQQLKAQLLEETPRVKAALLELGRIKLAEALVMERLLDAIRDAKTGNSHDEPPTPIRDSVQPD